MSRKYLGPNVAQRRSAFFFNTTMLLKPSALVAGMSGKASGGVAFRTTAGLAIRNFVVPINPSTAAQTLRRSGLSDFAKAWGGDLDDGQRQAWADYGRQAGAKNVWGDNIKLSGIAAYQSVNRIIQNCGGTRVDDAPVSMAVPSILSLAIVANHTASVLTLSFSPTPLITPNGLYVFATPALSPGIMNVSNKLRFIGFFDAAATTDSISTEWQAVFGAFPAAAGQRIAVSVAVANADTGAISAYANANTLVI